MLRLVRVPPPVEEVLVFFFFSSVSSVETGRRLFAPCVWPPTECPRSKIALDCLVRVFVAPIASPPVLVRSGSEISFLGLLLHFVGLSLSRACFMYCTTVSGQSGQSTRFLSFSAFVLLLPTQRRGLLVLSFF